MQLPPMLTMATLTMAQVMELPAAAEAVRAAEARCVGGASLAARLFRPVQRMCVYPLLFRELLKMESKADAQCEETAIVDVHRAALHRAMSAMHAVVMQVNEEVRTLETQRTPPLTLNPNPTPNLNPAPNPNPGPAP